MNIYFFMVGMAFQQTLVVVQAQFDFGDGGGGGGGGGTSDSGGTSDGGVPSFCGGSGSFEQEIQEGTRIFVGDIPMGLQGLQIQLTSLNDIDIQLTSGSTEVIHWQEGGIIANEAETTVTWNSDSITYSGYNGDGSGSLGNEFVVFHDELSNSYQMYAFGYESGLATVTYSWTGEAGCTEEEEEDNDGAVDVVDVAVDVDLDPSGSGTFTQQIVQDSVVTIGDLPAGLSNLYVRLDSSADIDIQLYDGSTAVVKWKDGVLSGSTFERKSYSGLQIQYSGYNGEQRSGTFGQEYIYIEGVLPRTFSMRVLGYESGTATVKYSWGYYATATGSTSSMLKSQLHDIIDDHIQLSYTPGVWDGLKRTDQDNDNPDNLIMFYSRRSQPKASQDNGSSNGEDAWNREHVYAKSHGNFGTAAGAGTDIHALRAADKSVNSERSNKDFANGGSPLSSTEPRDDCPLCKETDDSFEPPDDVKGDVARMIFYMAVRYNGDTDSNGLTLNVVDGVGTPNGSSTTDNGVIGDLATLKAWHLQDPVSDEERHRNNIIYDIQGNRNPFIDNPQFVDMVF